LNETFFRSFIHVITVADKVNKRMELVLAKIRYQIDIESRARDTISRTRDGTSDLISNPKVFKSMDYSIQPLKNIAGAHFDLRARSLRSLPASSDPWWISTKRSSTSDYPDLDFDGEWLESPD
jgi:hypothetical protein